MRTFSQVPFKDPCWSQWSFLINSLQISQIRNNHEQNIHQSSTCILQELVTSSRMLLCSQGTQRWPFTDGSSPPSFSAEDAEWAGAPRHLLARACLAEHSPAASPGKQQVPDTAELEAQHTSCIIQPLTTYSPNTEDNPHQPHKRSTYHQYTCWHRNLDCGRKLRIELPPAVRSAKVVMDKEEERTPGWAKQTQAACNAEKRGHKNKTWQNKLNNLLKY